MKKRIYIEFSLEEAEVMVNVINETIARRQKFMERFPYVDVSETITKLIYDNLELLEDAVLLSMDVVLEVENKPVNLAALLVIAGVACDMSEFLEDQHLYNQCILRLIYAGRGE